jgi:hypothetical protein
MGAASGNSSFLVPKTEDASYKQRGSGDNNNM